MRKVVVLALLAALLPLSDGRAAVLPQNDAGSGGDAPNSATSGFRVRPGEVYEGTLEGFGLDADDWYAISVPAGSVLQARAAGGLGCLRVYDALQNELASQCTLALAIGAVATARVPHSATYYVRYSYLQPDAYRFSLGIDAPAPDPTRVEVLTSARGMPRVHPAANPADKHVVVAVIDTGINLYHEFFRAPALTKHPSGWLPAFPRGAQPVRLSLGAADYAAARARDDESLAAMERSTYHRATGTFTERLYTFPGTRVVGGISFGEYADATASVLPPATRPVLDDHGHGTHSAGLALGANMTHSDGNVLVVAVEVGKGTFEDGIRWAARQPWIDALSVSLGTVANVPTTGADTATYEAAKRGKPVFVASGNGVSSTGLTPDRCSTYTSSYTGPEWVTRVGAAEAGSGSATWWHCVPVDVIGRTHVDSAAHDAFTGGAYSSGTSAATPNVAGHFAHLLLTARRTRPRETRTETLRYLLQSAAPATWKPGPSSPGVYPLSLAEQGYGLVDGAALDDARGRLLAGAGPRPRPETETWFANDAAIRRRLWPAPA